MDFHDKQILISHFSSHCIIQYVDEQMRTCIYKNIRLYFYSWWCACVEQRRWEGECTHTRSWRECNHASGVSAFLPKFSTLNNAWLPWDHTPPPILIGHLLHQHNHCLVLHRSVHAHSLYALCMFRDLIYDATALNHVCTASPVKMTSWCHSTNLSFRICFSKHLSPGCDSTSLTYVLITGPDVFLKTPVTVIWWPLLQPKYIIDCIIFFRGGGLDCYITVGIVC